MPRNSTEKPGSGFASLLVGCFNSRTSFLAWHLQATVSLAKKLVPGGSEKSGGLWSMEGRGRGKGYGWAISAGLNAALAAIAAKFFSSQLVKYGMVIFFNVTMWGCYVNSLKALPSLQATVTNFATNFLSSGLAGFFLFGEPLSSKWFAGALLIVFGVFILSKSSIEKKKRSD